MALAISTLDVMIKIIVLGLRKNIFTELAPKFRLDLVAPIEQIHRNPDPIGISRILRLRRRQRWPEVGMRKCEVVFTQALGEGAKFDIKRPFWHRKDAGGCLWVHCQLTIKSC